MFKILLIFLVVSTSCMAESRDPTQPAYLQPSSGTVFHGGYNKGDSDEGNYELVLSAILISPQSRRATINGISAKQGDTIEINQASAVPPPKKGNAGQSAQKNLLTPLLEAATKAPPKHEDLKPDPQTRMDTAQHVKTASIPSHSNTVKIIRVDKNSVTVDQNGELKTLQLVHRPYKNTQNSHYFYKK